MTARHTVVFRLRCFLDQFLTYAANNFVSIKQNDLHDIANKLLKLLILQSSGMYPKVKLTADACEQQIHDK